MIFLFLCKNRDMQLKYIFKIFILSLLFISTSNSIFAQKEETETVFIPAEYDTIYEDIKVKDAYYELIHHLAVLDTMMIEVKLKEKSRILKENWKTTYSFTKKPDADSIGGKWVGVKEKGCVSQNPEDCRYEILVPESPEYDLKTMTNYIGATWDEENELPETIVYVPRIIEIKAARVERIYIPAKYETIEKYILRKRAKIITRPKD